MTTDIDIWQSTAVAASGVARETPAGQAIEQRADIIAMTQAAEDAVLRPNDPGAWGPDLRAALACRIAFHNGAHDLSEHYRAQVVSSAYLAICDPGTATADGSLAAAIAYVDRVATQPRDITAQDIKHLQSAQISDADIVRLTELVAFMGYQVRLTAGLALLTEVQQ